MKHGEPEEVDLPIFLGPDPDLALVKADMDAWAEAHPCDCEDLCEC
jgi:hypothetical protein